MQKRYDATLKGLLERTPEAWPMLVGQRPAPVTVVDADVSTVTAASDKVLRVSGEPDWLLDVNFQAGPDASLPERVHLYNTLLRNRHRLHTRSLVVLLAPKAHLSAIDGRYEERYPEEAEPYLSFRYNVLRVWEQPPGTFLEGGVGLLPLAPLAAVTEAELPQVVTRLQERIRQTERTVAAELWTATGVLMGLRWEPAVLNRLLEGVMSLENESWVYQAIVQEGVARGIRLEARKNLLLLGAKKFGPPESSVREAVEAITDVERLEQLILRVSDVNSWQELLA